MFYEPLNVQNRMCELNHVNCHDTCFCLKFKSLQWDKKELSYEAINKKLHIINNMKLTFQAFGGDLIFGLVLTPDPKYYQNIIKK